MSLSLIRSKLEIKKFQSNFIEITLPHGCSPLYLLHIFRTPFYKNILIGILLDDETVQSRFHMVCSQGKNIFLQHCRGGAEFGGIIFSNWVLLDASISNLLSYRSPQGINAWSDKHPPSQKRCTPPSLIKHLTEGIGQIWLGHMTACIYTLKLFRINQRYNFLGKKNNKK